MRRKTYAQFDDMRWEVRQEPVVMTLGFCTRGEHDDCPKVYHGLTGPFACDCECHPKEPKP